jgi:pimeloyl-ACP methyl ester carboxylesterase
MQTLVLGLAIASALENGSFTLERGGRTLHYEVHGTGPVLMTVPNSWGLSLEGLRAMYRPLEEHVTMVYFDPRGMGGSSPVREDADMGPDAVREDFHVLRGHLGLRTVNAIGWSNGAYNLIVLAADDPEIFETAIFVHGTASFLPEDGRTMVERYPDLFQAFREFGEEMSAFEGDEHARNARVKVFDTEVWFPWMYANVEEGRKALPELFRDASFSWAHAEYTNQVWPTIDLMDRLSSIRARSLVIAGSHDMLPLEKAREMATAIPKAEFVEFAQSGHFAPVEEREKFLQAVLSFLGAN